MNYFDVSQPFSNEDIQTLLSIEFEQEIFDFAFGVDEAQVSSDLVQSHVKEIDIQPTSVLQIQKRFTGKHVQQKTTRNSNKKLLSNATALPFYQTMTRDHRRDYARMFVNVHNMGDTNVLQKFFREFCTPGCRYVAEFPNAGRFNAPKVRRSKNREELIADVLYDTSIFPDMTCQLLKSRVVKRAGYVGSQLVFRLAMKGTVYRRADPCIDSLSATNGIAGRRAFYANQAASSGTTGSGALRRKLCFHQRKLRQYEETLLQTTQSTSCLSLEQEITTTSMESDMSDSSKSNSSIDSISSSSSFCSASFNSVAAVYSIENIITTNQQQQRKEEEEWEECLLCQAMALNKDSSSSASLSPLIFDSPIPITTYPLVTFYLDEFHRIYCYEILVKD